MARHKLTFLVDGVLDAGEGKIFNQLLRTAGIDREGLVVLDTRSWRPEKLAQASPNVVVPMGPAALMHYTGQTNLGAYRGAVIAATQAQPGLKLLPTYSPLLVEKNWKLFHVVASDLEKAVRESEFPEIRLAKRELWLNPTLDDIRYFKAKWLDGADLTAVDIETGFGQITMIGFAPSPQRAIVVPFVDFRKPNRSYWPTAQAELDAWCLVEAILDGPEAKLLQNGPYDVFWLWDVYGLRVRNYRHDTRLLHHALYPELPKSLEFMGACYAQQGPWKLMRPGREEKKDA
jgi:hypothetical protein